MNRSKALGTALENAVVAEAVAAGHKARRQPLSGILAEFPSDAIVDDVLLECKVRAPIVSGPPTRKSFRFDLNWLAKVVHNAGEHGFRMGAVVFRAKGSQHKYVVIRYEDFLPLLHSQ